MSPRNRMDLRGAGAAGVVLAVGAVLAFIVLWIVLGQWGVTNIARLLLALCLPPALLSIGFGVYMLVTRSRSGG